MGKRMVPRVIIVGAGFAGLAALKELAKARAEVVVVDQNNYHTFFPLLYQIAAAELSPEQVVTPARALVRKRSNARFQMARVERADLERQVLVCDDGQEVPYDYLILAPGSVPHAFGAQGVTEYAFPLRSLDEGVALRNQILRRFEEASTERDAERRRRLLTVAIVGGGYTGVEFAGALAELVNGPLAKDFREIDVRREARIVIVEAMDRLVPGMPDEIAHYTLNRLHDLGVQVRLNASVARVEPRALTLQDGEGVETETVVWTAGHRGHPIGETMNVETNRRGQVVVSSTLEVPSHPNVFVAGDLAAAPSSDGRPLPMVAPVAIQQGERAARNVRRALLGLEPLPFRYRDRGMLAVIGRNKAIARIGRRTFTGFPAWVLWIVLHLYQLIGARNRLLVMINWAWDYFRYERAVRLILPSGMTTGPERRRERDRRRAQTLEAT